MKKNIKQHLINYNKKMAETLSGWELHEDNPELLEEELLETLFECGEEVHREVTNSSRWWNDVFIVKEIDGMFIGYEDAETTGDSSASELGFEFDKETIEEYEVKTKTKTITYYELKK